MLGKGLESLIPSRKPGGSDDATIPTPVGEGASSAPSPASNVDFVFLHAGASDASSPVVAGHSLDVDDQLIEPYSTALEHEVVVASTNFLHMPDVGLPQVASVPAPTTAATPTAQLASTQPASFDPHQPVAAPVKKPKEIVKPEAKFPDAVFHIETYKIVANPQQPRRYFDDDAINDLAASIREFGILQPIVVTKLVKESDGGADVEYQLIAGERRLLAARKLGMETVPAIIKNVDIERERLELAIIENLQRENLSAIEMARAFAKLQDEFRLTQREIATRLGKSRETVANTMRLLDLPPAVQQAIEEGKISESHGRLLLGIGDVGTQDKLFHDLLGKKMTTRELKSRLKTIDAQKQQANPHVAQIKFVEEKLSADLGAPVRISASGDSGKIVINYYSKEELDQIIQKLRAGGLE